MLEKQRAVAGAVTPIVPTPPSVAVAAPVVNVAAPSVSVPQIGAVADVVRGAGGPVLSAGDAAKTLTQTDDGRLRVDRDDRVVSAIVALTEEVRQLRAMFALVHGIND